MNTVWIKAALAAIILLAPLASFSQDVVLEPITVEKRYSGETAQDNEYIYLDDAVLFSLEEIAGYSSSIGLKKRSGFGIQQDLSLRGSIFEDSSISLEGIKINDPQTGHFSLELPFTSADLEKAEILKNSQKLNFHIKKPQKQGTLLKTSFGQHALTEKLLSINFPLKDVSNRFSAEHKISKGDKPDTDFEIYNLSLNSLLEKEDKELEFLFGFTKRDFGAANFYAASRPQEEEHVTQRFFSLRAGLKEELFDLNSTLYFRRHTDKFILDRNNPPFYTNYHTSYVQGIKTEADFDNDLFFALDIGREKVTSTNLSRRRRQKQGFNLGVKEKELGSFILNAQAGLEHASDWDFLESGRMDIKYLIKDNLRLKFSYDRLWRGPSFTELYYSSSYDRGNPNLKVQKSNNFEIGAGYSPWQNLDLSLNTFVRDQTSTIDWVKNSSLDPWQAENVEDLTVYGVDFYTQLRLDNCLLSKASLGYTYMDLNKDNSYAFSKYVFDYNRHKIVSDFGFNIKGVSVDFISRFSNPVDRKRYATVDLKVQKKLADLTLALEGSNIFNKDYEEMKDIEGQGRWYKMSLSYSF